MPGFMNAELEALRENLVCGYCGAKFKGTDSQARKFKYENRVPYCSEACRRAGSIKKKREYNIRVGNKLRKGVLTGPCKHCGKMFESLIDKIYCSMDCYVQSEQFREMQKKHCRLSEEVMAKIAEKNKRGKMALCLECGTEFYQKRSTKSRPAKKFCSTVCYRSYLAKRFDRWMANPESIVLVQCYDEFLDSEELSCVVEGCNWKGKNLSLHINQAHGVPAIEFKRAAGFNVSTGVVAKPLAIKLCERDVVGVAAGMDDTDRVAGLNRAKDVLAANQARRTTSLEGREHNRKARALLCVTPGPERTCAGCGKVFQQKNPLGLALFCSLNCRDKAYADKRRRLKPPMQRVRQPDGTFRWISPNPEPNVENDLNRKHSVLEKEKS